MAVSSRRRSASLAALALAAFYLAVSVVDRRREIIRDREVRRNESFFFVNDGSQELLEAIKRPKEVMQSDPRLAKIIRSYFLHPPSTLPYNLSRPVDAAKVKGQEGQSVLVDRILGGAKNRFFVEAGAFDGEYLSNTLFFELRRNWTGLLVEPNGRAFSDLLAKNRRGSWAVHSCLALNEWPEEVEFDAADVFGGIVTTEASGGNNASSTPAAGDAATAKDESVQNEVPSAALDKLRSEIDPGKRYKETVQCFPLYSLLLAMGNPTVDYLSLDVEGSELEVLKTIPFDKVNIRVISVEVVHSRVKDIVRHLVFNGYRVNRRLRDDIVFQKVF